VYEHSNKQFRGHLRENGVGAEKAVFAGWLPAAGEGVLYGAGRENWRIKISHFCYLTESGRVEESMRSDFLLIYKY